LTARLSGQPGSQVYSYFVLGMAVLSLGVNWPIVSIGLETISPLWMMTLRLWGGAMVGFAMNALAGQRPFVPRQDRRIVPILGVFRLLGIFLLVFFALQVLPPGRSGILVWTGALWAVPMAVIFLGERMSRMQIAGLAAGMVGLAVVLEPWGFSLSEPRVLWAYLMLLGASLSAAWTSVYMRAHRWGSNSLASTPWQMVAGGIPALTAALVFDGIPDVAWTSGTVFIVLFQMTLAGPVVVWGQMEAFRNLPAISVNLTLMAVPVVGLLSSWWLVDEQLTLGVVSGLALITAGVAASIVGDRNLRPVRSGLT